MMLTDNIHILYNDDDDGYSVKDIGLNEMWIAYLRVCWDNSEKKNNRNMNTIKWRLHCVM